MIHLKTEKFNDKSEYDLSQFLSEGSKKKGYEADNTRKPLILIGAWGEN